MTGYEFAARQALQTEHGWARSISARYRFIRWLPWLVLGFGLALTYFVQASAQKAEEQIRHELFVFRVDEIAANLHARLRNDERLLNAAAAMLATTPSFTNREFKKYVGGLELDGRYHGLSGVGLVRAAASAAGSAGPYVAIVRPDEPGYDSRASVIRTAMKQARDSRRTAVSGKVLLAGTKPVREPGFVMYVPVYRARQASARGRSDFLGWIYAPFNMDRLMRGILGNHFDEIDSSYDIELYDGSSATAASRLFDSDREPERAGAILHMRRPVELFGHHWTLSVSSLPQFDVALKEGNAGIIAVAGTIGSLMLALLAWMFAGRHRRARELAEAMTRQLRASKDSLEALFENMSSGVAVLRPSADCSDFVFDAYNQAAEKIDQTLRREVIGRRIQEVLPGVAEMGLLEVLRRVCRTGVPERLPAVRYRDTRIDGWRDNYVYRLPNNDVVAMYDDISAGVSAQEEQNRLNRALRMLSDCNMALVHAEEEYDLLHEICRLIVEHGGYRMAWVGYAEHDEMRTVRPIAQFGYETGYLDTVNITWADTERGQGPTGTAIRTGATNINQSYLADPRMTPWREAAIERGYQASIALPLINEGATLGALTLYAAEQDAFNAAEVSLLEELAGDLAFGIVALRTGTERVAAEEQAIFLAHHDVLTNLPKRLLLRDRFELAIRVAEQGGNGIALLYLDLDNFKQVNDSLGHEAGDRLLVMVVRLLERSIPESAAISRLGDDEFAVLLTESDGPAAAALASAILGAFAEPLVIGDTHVMPSFSIGISLYPEDGIDFDTLLKNAGIAVSHAKEGGRNTYRFYDLQMNRDSLDQLRLQGQLHDAIRNEEFIVHYQPQVDIHSGRVVGAEALVRWQHPSEGLIPPGRFIPIAEQSGYIIQIGEWVLNQACHQGRKWLDEGLGPLVVAVNLSALQFRRGNLLNLIHAALNESGLPPEALELELTESILLQDADTTMATLRALKDLGVRLSIDDFGTGYSSLSYLKRLAVDKLKVDQSFVRDLASDPDDASIVEAVIQLGHALQLTVIAEGVETEAHLAFLAAHGCDEAQGYWFSRPVSAEQCGTLFASGLSGQ